MSYKKTAMMIMTLIVTTALSTVSAQEKESAAVKSATDKLIQAMLKPEQSVLNALVTDNLTYGHSSGKIETKKEFVETLVTGKSVFENIQRVDETISVVDHTAIVRHTLLAKTNDPGKGPSEIKLGIALTWVKTHGSWKLLARQAYRLP
ncbi:nuclear transport factor 2 family protein [Sphingobacterium suaedae]|uniref:Nuclear transport factor 2 family protein n=1 Tax=Sphingobacterium suaedae TaxID=1686402 RepID=A0ABW5KH08_9SPHI